MKAIATLVQNDPYLKLSPADRIAARRERVAKLAAKPEVKPKPIDIPKLVEIDPVDIEAAWIERQKKIYPPVKKPWFCIVDELGKPEPRVPSIKEIQQAVVTEFPMVTVSDLNSSRRTAEIVGPRQIAMYMAKFYTTRSFPEIGRHFGGRDHTTVIHAIRKIGRLCKTNPQIAAHVENIKAVLAEMPS